MDFKSLLIGALGSALLFVSVGAGFSEQTTTQTMVPSSHVWSFHLSNPSSEHSAVAFALNKKTGEVRKYNAYHTTYANIPYDSYLTVTED